MLLSEHASDNVTSKYVHRHDLIKKQTGLFNIHKGGSGNDTLTVGLDNEQYAFELGFGQDSIQEKGGNDIIKFGIGIDVNSLLVTKSGIDLNISLKGTFDQITVKDWAVSAKEPVESIQFHNGDRVDLNPFER